MTLRAHRLTYTRVRTHKLCRGTSGLALVPPQVIHSFPPLALRSPSLARALHKLSVTAAFAYHAAVLTAPAPSAALARRPASAPRPLARSLLREEHASQPLPLLFCISYFPYRSCCRSGFAVLSLPLTLVPSAVMAAHLSAGGRAGGGEGGGGSLLLRSPRLLAGSLLPWLMLILFLAVSCSS